MTDILPDTIRRLYTDPGEYIDSDHPAVQQFAEDAVRADASVRAGGVWPSRLVSDSGLLHTIDMVALFHSGYFCESSSP